MPSTALCIAPTVCRGWTCQLFGRSAFPDLGHCLCVHLFYAKSGRANDRVTKELNSELEGRRPQAIDQRESRLVPETKSRGAEASSVLSSSFTASFSRRHSLIHILPAVLDYPSWRLGRRKVVSLPPLLVRFQMAADVLLVHSLLTT